MTQQPAPRVFISYSHDNAEHATRVLKLANDLRRDGVDAVIDQYLTSPDEGWPLWMERHVREDDFVVMVCTPTYYRRVANQEKPGTGLGVRWEGSLIYNAIYKAEGDLSRFVLILPNGGRLADIPDRLVGGTHYDVDTPTGYESLLRRLFNRPAAEMPPIGERPTLPHLQVQWTTRPLAALHNVPELPPHFIARANLLSDLKEKLLAANGGAVGVTGIATKIGVQGMGGIGKSVLAAALACDGEIRSTFPAGIFWISLGQMPDVLARQADLYWLLTREKGGFADAQQGRIALQEALRSRSCLVVLDDVWRLADAEAFNVVDTDARLPALPALEIPQPQGAVVRAGESAAVGERRQRRDPARVARRRL